MVPKYAKGWGDVRPVASISGQYNTDIPLNRIFLLFTESEPDGKLVVRRACKPCLIDKVACTRKGPKCCYCEENNQLCSYDNPSDYVDLPGMDPNMKAVGVVKTQQRVKKPSPDDTNGDTEKSSMLHIRGRKMKDNKKVSELESIRSPAKKRKLAGSETIKRGKVTWNRVRVVPPEESVAKLIEPSNLPRIWSETYEELLGAVPALASMNNGCSDDGSLAPTILLDRSSWPNGVWDGGERIELSTLRMFSFLDMDSNPPLVETKIDTPIEVPKDDFRSDQLMHFSPFMAFDKDDILGNMAPESVACESRHYEESGGRQNLHSGFIPAQQIESSYSTPHSNDLSIFHVPPHSSDNTDMSYLLYSPTSTNVQKETASDLAITSMRPVSPPVSAFPKPPDPVSTIPKPALVAYSRSSSRSVSTSIAFSSAHSLPSQGRNAPVDWYPKPTLYPVPVQPSTSILSNNTSIHSCSSSFSSSSTLRNDSSPAVLCTDKGFDFPRFEDNLRTRHVPILPKTFTSFPSSPGQIPYSANTSSDEGVLSSSTPRNVTAPIMSMRSIARKIQDISEELPADISKLQKAYYDGFPVAIIIHRDWPRFPLKLDPKCKFIVLGFFRIEDMRKKFESSYHSTRSGLSRRRGEVEWMFTFQWVPGGVPEIPTSHLQPSMEISESSARAWWLPPSPHNEEGIDVSNTKFDRNDQNRDSSGTPSSRQFFSPIMLDLNILSKHIARDGQYTSRAARSWYCIKCGRVNRTHWITRYPCSYCPSEIKNIEIEDLDNLGTLYYPPEVIQAAAVRDRLRPTPMWTPTVHLPPNVDKRTREWRNGLRWFAYSYRCSSTRKGKERVHPLIIDYLFLGNRVNLEDKANRLFADIQQSVPMAFESMPSKPTGEHMHQLSLPLMKSPSFDYSIVIHIVGIFKFNISPTIAAESHDGHATWSTAHECMINARMMMIAGARSCGKEQMSEESITHLSYIAWLGASPVKTEIQAKAKQHPVLLMSLGADLEVVFANPGESQQQRKKPRSKNQKVLPNAILFAIPEQDIQNETSQASIGDAMSTLQLFVLILRFCFGAIKNHD
ncbi:hypothetical protein EW145_g3102 [Phellinidium pouzarii]|uniref:Zn(2)-C6 fungal-type domain-containing protein n=1 Tax=Phellinidium pouzarii TaxID=167371 RepID=A0A4S4LDW1_9AGAM|nr:hypothetical protein EW145_g3102 [Phellinidium pouzarii]